MKPDFNVMSRAELRNYVLTHREDTEAFQALADRIYANPNQQWYQPEETEKIVDLLPSNESTDIEN
jgi:hypothetical protein